MKLNMTIKMTDKLVKLSSSECSLFDRFNIDVEGKRVRSMSGTLHTDLNGVFAKNIQDDQRLREAIILKTLLSVKRLIC